MPRKPPESVLSFQGEEADEEARAAARRDPGAAHQKLRRPTSRAPRLACPIYRRVFSGAKEYDLHYQWELNRVETFEYISGLETDTPKRVAKDAAVAARKSSASSVKRRHHFVDEPEIEEDEKVKKDFRKVLIAVRRNRRKRAAADKPSSRSRTVATDIQTCFICDSALTGMDHEEINYHIDRCLARSNPQSSSSTPYLNVLTATNAEDLEEYEWAGQTRVRATSMVNGGAAALGHAVSTNSRGSQDIEDDVNIDGDDRDLFGVAQYDDSWLQRAEATDTDDETVTEGEFDGRGATHRARAAHLSNTAPAIKSGCSALRVVDSLRTRIRELEAANKCSPRCLICLDPYRTPVTSVVCWHTHCEVCWLRSLSAKKVCPQCQAITSAADLRRVYV